MATWEFVDCQENASSKTARVHAGERVLSMSGGIAQGSQITPCDRQWCGYRDILVPFARQHFGDNFCYQDHDATPHRSRVMTDYPQQEGITKMDQSAQSPDCNPIDHLWDELGHAINNMDDPPHNLNELRQAPVGQYSCGMPAGSGGQHVPATSGHYQSYTEGRWHTLLTNQPWKSVIELFMCEISAWLVTFWPMPDRSNLHIQCNFILPRILNFPPILKYTLNPNAGEIHLETNTSA